MAIRPFHRSHARIVRRSVCLLVAAIAITLAGCGRDEAPPVAVTVEETAQANNEAIQSPPGEKPKDAGKFYEDAAKKFKSNAPSAKNGNPPESFLSRNLLSGSGMAGGSAAPVQGFNGQAGQLFQGGQGVLGMGGGVGGLGGGLGGFGGGFGGNPNGPALFDPTQPPGFNPDMSAEKYQRFEDNPFKFVKGEDALSTISTAVDTASYSNVRARINEGALPTKDAVRIADFVNYFPYDYAAPKNADPVAFSLEMAPCPWQPKHHLLRIGLKSKTIDKDQVPARNLVFLVDTSGSMQADNRLPLVIESLRLLVEQLTDRDRVSIVTYAGDAGLRLPPTPGDKKEVILEVIHGLSAGGSTNGEGGIKVAYEQAEKTFLKDGINRVILATDGDFNVGVSDTAELTRLIEEKRKTGVYLTVLGYGMGNLHDETLEQLAHHGNGHYAYIDSLDEARKVFVEQGGALVTVAKDVKLQVEFNPAKVAGYRLIGYENRILRHEDFRNDAKDAGDMGSGHTCTALYEIVPVGEKVNAGEVEALKYQTKPTLTDAAKTGEWLTVRMRYKHPETDKASEVSSVLPADKLAKEASESSRFASAVAAFGMILRDSEYRGTADYEKVLDWAKAAIGADKGGHRAEFVRIVEKAMCIAGKLKNE
jgi:Ca-activated chloride channel family protein